MSRSPVHTTYTGVKLSCIVTENGCLDGLHLPHGTASLKKTTVSWPKTPSSSLSLEKKILLFDCRL